MAPPATEWINTPSSSIEDSEETSSCTSNDDLGGPINHHDSPKSTSTTTISKDTSSETRTTSKRRRRDPQLEETADMDPHEPQQMIDRWYKNHPDHAPDPAVLRKTYAGPTGRPVKVMDLVGNVLKVGFHNLVVYKLEEVEENNHGVWILEDSQGRKRIVKRRRLGKSLKMLLSQTTPEKDQNADAAFFAWLGEGDFSKDPAGYIITESLDTQALTPEQMNELPVIYAFTSDPAEAKTKRVKPGEEKLPLAMRRSSRGTEGRPSYRVDAKSFPKYADDSTEKARRASNTSTLRASPSRSTRSKSRKITSPRHTRRKSTSKVFDSSVSPPSPPPKKFTEQKSNAAPPHVRFEFQLLVRKSARYRDVSKCNDVEKFFAEVHKAATIDKQTEKPNVATCKFSWLPGQREQAVLEGDDDDFEDLMKTIENAPAGKDCTVEVYYLIAS